MVLALGTSSLYLQDIANLVRSSTRLVKIMEPPAVYPRDFIEDTNDPKPGSLDAVGAPRIALVIRHLWELSDSIGYDCLGQLQLLRDLGGDGAEIRIFCEFRNEQHYAVVPTEPVSSLQAWLGERPGAYVIYHYCDGWPAFDDLIPDLPARVVVRWHNNTPPWFFAKYSPQPTLNTIRGLEGIMRIGASSRAAFWTNSTYSATQLSVLGVDSDRLHVVYPVSAWLFGGDQPRSEPGRNDGADVIQVLFVGRVVPHKGHLHLVMTAATLQARFRRRVRLTMVGRFDSTLMSYVKEINTLAEELDVDAYFPAEVSNSDLQAFYRESDVFLCLSEHEGFGIPIFEAMRFGLPVVGLRSTATGEFLAHHPLGLESMDYEAAAENVLAATVPALRDVVVRWQDVNLTSFYTTGLVARQLESGLKGSHLMPPAAGKVDLTIAEAVAGFRAMLQDTHPIGPRPRGVGPPADAINRYITRYDVEAFGALATAAPGGQAPVPTPRKKRGPIKRILREIERFAKRTWRIVAPAGGAR